MIIWKSDGFNLFVIHTKSKDFKLKHSLVKSRIITYAYWTLNMELYQMDVRLPYK